MGQGGIVGSAAAGQHLAAAGHALAHLALEDLELAPGVQPARSGCRGQSRRPSLSLAALAAIASITWSATDSITNTRLVARHAWPQL